MASDPAKQRTVNAKDVLADPQILSTYPHRLVILTFTGRQADLLNAAELLEDQGWTIVSAASMFLLLRRN